jgi:hypothetical protein
VSTNIDSGHFLRWLEAADPIARLSDKGRGKINELQRQRTDKGWDKTRENWLERSIHHVCESKDEDDCSRGNCHSREKSYLHRNRNIKKRKMLRDKGNLQVSRP